MSQAGSEVLQALPNSATLGIGCLSSATSCVFSAPPCFPLVTVEDEGGILHCGLTTVASNGFRRAIEAKTDRDTSMVNEEAKQQGLKGVIGPLGRVIDRQCYVGGVWVIDCGLPTPCGQHVLRGEVLSYVEEASEGN